jgi:co-chaperonin GroES (HSP10)
MEDLVIIDKIKKAIKNAETQIQDTMMSGGVDNMEKYKYLLGQAHAYQIILQEISNLLNYKEQKNEQGNIIDIGDKKAKQESHAKRLDPDNIQDVADQLPEPSGYRLLLLPFTPREKTKGGILFSQEQLDKARIATTCGYVLKMGDLAYKDNEKFIEPWCKVGDWVIFARYAGSRLPIEGGEVRIINDDEVLGTIKDPESILHYI